MALRTLFWQHAARSLPPAVRRRYAAELELGERVDLFIGRLVDAWRDLQQARAARRLRRKIMDAYRL